MALEGDIEPVFEYKTGVKYRWLLPADLFHVMTNLSAFPQFVRDFGDRTMRYDIDMHDPAPTVVQAGMTAAEFVIRVKQHRFRRPHGQPDR
jgi:hypothetical protein